VIWRPCHYHCMRLHRFTAQVQPMIIIKVSRVCFDNVLISFTIMKWGFDKPITDCCLSKSKKWAFPVNITLYVYTYSSYDTFQVLIVNKTFGYNAHENKSDIHIFLKKYTPKGHIYSNLKTFLNKWNLRDHLDHRVWDEYYLIVGNLKVLVHYHLYLAYICHICPIVSEAYPTSFSIHDNSHLVY